MILEGLLIAVFLDVFEDVKDDGGIAIGIQVDLLVVWDLADVAVGRN